MLREPRSVASGHLIGECGVKGAALISKEFTFKQRSGHPFDNVFFMFFSLFSFCPLLHV